MDTLTLHGMVVPASDYEHLKRLEHIAFGFRPADEPARDAHRKALTMAQHLLATLREANSL